MPGKREEFLNWEEYFLGLSLVGMDRSKDSSTQVAACIVDDDNITVGLGYNGLTIGMNDDSFHWDSIGEETGDILKTKNTSVVHAELNAILNSRGSVKGTTMYVTLFPCNECAKAIIQSGIKKVVYLRMYSNPKIVEATKIMFDAAGVEYIPYNKNKSFSKEEVQEAAHEIQKIIKRFS